MKIDLDRLENIERAVIYIKAHEKTVFIGGKEYVLISKNVWDNVQKALDESEAEANVSYVEQFKEAIKRTDEEGESHDHYGIGTYVLVKTGNGFRVGIVIGNAGVGYSTVALFEQWVESQTKWLKAEVLPIQWNSMLTRPCSTEVANPCRFTAHHLKTLKTYCGIKVKISSSRKSNVQYGYVVGTARYYSGVPTQVYVATLNEPGKPGRIYTASVANLQREDGTLLRLSQKGVKK
jgi:hypothetical protein